MTTPNVTDLYEGLLLFKNYVQANFPYKATYYEGIEDPTVGTGVLANPGAFYVQKDVNGSMIALYTKANSLNTGWSFVVGATPTAQWIRGVGVPAPEIGSESSYYERTDTQDVYFKGEGTWTVVGSIKPNLANATSDSTLAANRAVTDFLNWSPSFLWSLLDSYVKRTQEITASTYVLTALDLGQTLVFNSPDPQTIYVPENLTENLPTGFQCCIIRRGAGSVTFSKEGADVLESRDSLVLLSRYGIAVPYKHASGLWGLYGDLA